MNDTYYIFIHMIKIKHIINIMCISHCRLKKKYICNMYQIYTKDLKCNVYIYIKKKELYAE